MKKIIILMVLVFNLVPAIKKGKICFSNDLMAQSMGEEEADIRYPNGSHLVLYENGQYEIYWDPVAPGGPGEGTHGMEIGDPRYDSPPEEIDYDEDNMEPWEDMIDPIDGYFHAYFDQQEYLYEWDPLDRQWQLQIQINPNTPPAKSKYFILLNGERHRYYDGDKIYVQKSNTLITLTLQDESGNQINTADLTWIRRGIIDTVKCTGIGQCTNISVNVKGTTEIRVDSIGQKTLIKNQLIVSDKPMIIFQRGISYTGSYGFDDSCHKHYDLRAIPKYAKGLEVKKIVEDTSYVVPWMSILPQDQATIKIKKINLDSSLANDPNFWVEFRSSASGNIVINNSSSLHLTYAQLDAMNSLNISSSEWDTKLDSLKKNGNFSNLIRSIYAITNSGDTIGKLNITCSHPQVKQVVFVYVNTGTGYNTNLQKQEMLDYLNARSHGQIFRSWVLNTNYSDTLDLASEYTNNPLPFREIDSMPQFYRRMYNEHKNLDIKLLNQPFLPDKPGKIHFVFIDKLWHADTTYSTDPVTQQTVMSIKTTDGLTPMGSYFSSIFQTGDLKAVVHELGHILNIYHTFYEPQTPPGVPYHIPIHNTTNFMDYVPVKGINLLDMFYFTQWMDAL